MIARFGANLSDGKPGNAVGLSVSFGIAEAHGGSLSLASTDRGACFTLKLPLTAAMEMDRSDAAVLAARPY